MSEVTLYTPCTAPGHFAVVVCDQSTLQPSEPFSSRISGGCSRLYMWVVRMINPWSWRPAPIAAPHCMFPILARHPCQHHANQLGGGLCGPVQHSEKSVVGVRNFSCAVPPAPPDLRRLLNGSSVSTLARSTPIPAFCEPSEIAANV